MENKLKTTLKSYGIKESEIAEAIRHFDYAETHEIPWPLYYALTKLPN
jgi:hypothetical protein